jgi:hypothetical protein
MPTLGAPKMLQGEELLRHQGLDRCGVEGTTAVGQRGEVGARRHEALAGTRRRTQDHVAARDDLDQRLFLMRIEDQPLVLGPTGEGLEERVGAGIGGQLIGERHGRSMVPGPGRERQRAGR